MANAPEAVVQGGAGEPAAPLVPCDCAICPRFDSLGRDDATAPRKLGIMGGTFDPIHLGHLACAEQVREAFGLDAVVFMPAGDPWMKKGRRLASAPDRFAMVQAAVAGNPAFDVSALELNRVGSTYTVDTLDTLRAHYPANVQLYFIAGADALLRVGEWRDVAKISRLAHVVAVTRPGHGMDAVRQCCIEAGIAPERFSHLEATALDISSTDLREKVSAGRSIRYLVPEVVADYIAAHKLYAS